MATANPMDTPIPYQCQTHKCKKKIYSDETFSTCKVLGTRLKRKGVLIKQWVILTCPHCKETYTIHLEPSMLSICPFVDIEMPEYA